MGGTSSDSSRELDGEEPRDAGGVSRVGVAAVALVVAAVLVVGYIIVFSQEVPDNARARRGSSNDCVEQATGGLLIVACAHGPDLVTVATSVSGRIVAQGELTPGNPSLPLRASNPAALVEGTLRAVFPPDAPPQLTGVTLNGTWKITRKPSGEVVDYDGELLQLPASPD